MSDPMFTTLRTERNTALETPQLAPLTVRLHGTDETADLLKRLFRSFDGSLALRLWNGTILRLAQGTASIALTRRHLYR